jgi:hypothetical protein
MMTASFHVVEYHKRVLSPPRRLVGQVPGLRFWRALNVGGDFAWFRQHPTRRALYPRLRPDLHRWAFYAVWDDDAALDDFLDTSTISTSWRYECAEAWHIWLRPARAHGPWEGVRLLDPPAHDGPAHGPIAHLVRLDLSLRGTLAMWGSAAPNLLRHLPDDDELLAGIPLVDRPYTQPVSFGVWKSRASAMAFAHGRSGHPDAVARVRRSEGRLMERYSSAMFSPYRSQGTWHDRDPLAQSPPNHDAPSTDART